MDPNPIIAIVGQTATGKSAVAIELAERFGGEIICADSRTIYKGMDIGTAKPSAEDRARVPHHGLDLIDPSQNFSAYDFQQYAKAKIAEIQARRQVTFVVGGTGLYVDGLLYDYSFGPKASHHIRAQLAEKSLQDLQQMAKLIGLTESDVNYKNRRHLSRAVERGKITLQKKQLPEATFLGAIRLDKELLDTRIDGRIHAMVAQGLLEEVAQLVDQYGESAPGLLAPIYKPFVEHISGSCSLQQAIQKAVSNDRKLAKRQLTWFKRNPDIVWVQSVEDLKSAVTLFIER